MKRTKRNNNSSNNRNNSSNNHSHGSPPSRADLSQNWRQQSTTSSSSNGSHHQEPNATNSNGGGRNSNNRNKNNKNPPPQQQQQQQQQSPNAAGQKSPRHRSSPRQSKAPSSSSTTPLTVFTSDFARLVAATGAARYKVYRAGSDAPKIAPLRQRPKTIVGSNEGSQEKVNSVEDGNGNTPPYSHLDGLVVLPDIKRINHVYFCLETPKVTSANHDQNDNDEYWRRCELKLKQEIFANQQQHDQHFKVSCAQCLLRVQPNGFVCVTSPSLPTVEWARDRARAAVLFDQELHADHAHAVAALSRASLDQLLQAKTRHQTALAAAAVVEQLVQQEVEFAVTSTTDGATQEQQAIDIKLGHHLVSLLNITRKDTDAQVAFWMVLAYNDSPAANDDNNNNKPRQLVWSLDLPGGKRHLGETSLEGAIRETREESSLVVDESWVVPFQSPSKASHENASLPYRTGWSKHDMGNAYYMMRPPAELLMKEVEGDPFWQNQSSSNDDDKT